MGVFMKKMKAGFISSLMTALLLAVTPLVVAAINLVYSNGRIDAIKEDKIIVSGKTYILDPKVRVMVQTKNNNAYYETYGSRGDVHPGASVYIRAAGAKVVEIIVERWKQ